MAVDLLNGGSGPDVAGQGLAVYTIPAYSPSGVNLGLAVGYAGVGTAALTSIQRNSVDGTSISSNSPHLVHGSTYFSGAYAWSGSDCSGSYTIVVTFASSQTNFTGGAFYVTGMKQSAPRWTSERDTGQGTSLSLACSAYDEGLGVDFVMNQDSADLVPDGAQTEHYDHDAYQNSWDYGSGSYKAATGNITMAWTVSSSTWNVQIVVALNPQPLYIQQEGYRFFKDDGSESTATGEADQDVDVTIGKGVRKRLRVNRNFTSDPATEQVSLQYKKSGDADTEYRDVPLT